MPTADTDVAATSRRWREELILPRLRLISDNDYCGDPDGVVQAAHVLLAPTFDLRCLISSAVAPHHFEWTPDCPERGASVLRDVAALAGRTGVPIVTGTAQPLASPSEPVSSPAVEAIIDEAMRHDDLPLFVTGGGGLTAIASAYLLEPRIADRLTLVWIGGEPYSRTLDDLHPDVRYRETNLHTDLVAAQVVFGSPIPLWQIPQDVFSSLLVSRAEFLHRVATAGPLGAHVFDAVGARVDLLGPHLRMGEMYGLGDSGTVAATLLWGAYGAEPWSCRWITRPRPAVSDDGLYLDQPDGAPMRLFTHLDMRLLMEDFYARLALHAAGTERIAP